MHTKEMNSKERLLKTVPKYIKESILDDEERDRRRIEFCRVYSSKLHSENCGYSLYKYIREEILRGENDFVEIGNHFFLRWATPELPNVEDSSFGDDEFHRINLDFISSEGFSVEYNWDRWNDYKINIKQDGMTPMEYLDRIVGKRYEKNEDLEAKAKKEYISNKMETLKTQLWLKETRYAVFKLAKSASERDLDFVDFGIWDVLERPEQYGDDLGDLLDPFLYELLIQEGYTVEKPDDLYRIRW